MNWRKLNGDSLKDSLEKEVERVIIDEINQGHILTVCIGTDSQVYMNEVVFGSAIVFRRLGKGAFMFVRKERLHRYFTIKERMLLEVTKSIEIAYPLYDLFQFYKIPMEIHVDINISPMYKSNIAMKEALGYILSMGYDYKFKPDSFASSTAANMIVN